MIDIHEPENSRGLAFLDSSMIFSAWSAYMESVMDGTITDDKLAWVHDPTLVPDDVLSPFGKINVAATRNAR